MFPSLVNCCTIDWFTEWPKEALLGVSESFFENVELGDDELKVREVIELRALAELGRVKGFCFCVRGWVNLIFKERGNA